MKIVYIEALLMDNEEILHFGKTLGWAKGSESSRPNPNIDVVVLK